MVFVILAVSLWGGSAALAKYLFLTRYDPLIITQTRSSLSFLILALYFGVADRSVFRIKIRELYKFALIGIVGIATTNYTYYYTVKESTVATAILVQNIAPVVVMVYAVLVSKEEEFTGIKVLSLSLALFGCFLAVSGGSWSDIKLSGWSALTAPVSMLTYAFMLIASKQILRAYRVWTMLVTALGFATFFWFCVNPPWVVVTRGYGLIDWGIFFGFAIASILLPYIFFANGLKLLDASTAGIMTTLEPIIAITVAWIALGESINPVQVGGAIAVICSVVMLQVRRDYLRKIMRSDLHGK
jgi:drug/metabolite transporter (DMT)-like permease